MVLPHLAGHVCEINIGTGPGLLGYVHKDEPVRETVEKDVDDIVVVCAMVCRLGVDCDVSIESLDGGVVAGNLAQHMVSRIFQVIKVQSWLLLRCLFGLGLVYDPLHLAGQGSTFYHHFQVFGDYGHHAQICQFLEGAMDGLFRAFERDGEAFFNQLVDLGCPFQQ